MKGSAGLAASQHVKINAIEEIFQMLNDKAEFHALQADNYPQNSTLRAFHNGQAAAYEFSASRIVLFLKQNTLKQNIDVFRGKTGGGLGPEDIIVYDRG